MYLKIRTAIITVLLIMIGTESFAASKDVIQPSSPTLSFSVNVQQPIKSDDNILLRETFKPCLAASPACTLVMYQNSASGSLQITNTSKVPIHNMQAYNLPAGVTQDASNCTLIPPGGTCTLVFTPGSILNPGAVVTLYGTNTGQTTVIFQILPLNATPSIVVLGQYDLPTERLVVRYISNDYGTTWSSMLVLPLIPFQDNYIIGWTTCGVSGQNCLSTVSLNDGLSPNAFAYNSVNYGDQWTASPLFPLPALPGTLSNFKVIGNSCDTLNQNCVAVGIYVNTISEEYPVAYHSADGGNTWTESILPVSALTNYALSDVYCSSNGLVCIAAGTKNQPNPLGGPAAYITSDGGVNWVELAITSSQTIQSINRITCDTNVVRCFIVGNYDNGGNPRPIVFATPDSGANWNETLPIVPPDSNSFEDIIHSISCSDDATRCVIVGSYVNLGFMNKAFGYYTTDGGTTWNLSTNFPTPLGLDDTDLRDVFCNSNLSQCMGVGRALDTPNLAWWPATYITTDGGVNWSLTTTQPAPAPVATDSISLLNVSGSR